MTARSTWTVKTDCNILRFIAVFFIAFLLFRFSQNTVSASTVCQGGIINFVAHEDDDLLFLSPDLLHSVQNGDCVTTVFLTAGDNNNGSSYWMSREAGSKAAYAAMVQADNNWNPSSTSASGHTLPLFTLVGHPNINLIYMRLPDGNTNGSGFLNNNFESLQKLWQGTINNINSVDEQSEYSKQELTDTLLSLIESATPSQIRTQDFDGQYGDGDHSDHYTTAYFVKAANTEFPIPHTLSGYYGYPDRFLAANVFGDDYNQKTSAFLVYAQDDPEVCQSIAECQGIDYGDWLARQYIRDQINQNRDSPTNIALEASVSASSENTGTNQQAIKAIDGYENGYPGDYTKEWATLGEKAGAWINLSWSNPQTINQIVLFDRPNSDDWITGGGIVFSDGSSVNIGALNNNGSATIINFPSVSTTSVRLNITSVSSSTRNIGLSEFQVIKDGSGNDTTPTPSATPTSTPVPSETATPSPTPTPTPVVITLTNIAADATISASSENMSTSQQAVKATDGVIDGWPGDYSKEWATLGEKAGAWLDLKWDTPHRVTSVTLYDRPNSNDQITGATLTFSDGTSIYTGSLNNDGSANTIEFPAKDITELKLSVTGVSSSTINVGLAEIQVFENQLILTPTPTMALSPTLTLTATPTPTPQPTQAPTATPFLTLSPSPTLTPTPSPQAVNIAPAAAVSASSENTSTSQQAAKAVDGVKDGYPGDYTKEWATLGEKAGAWLNLSWASAHSISKILLYDRPNSDDQITGGVLLFSDGTSINIGSLNNNGSATEVDFSPRTVTSVKLTILSVSSSTKNIGLSEIEVY